MVFISLKAGLAGRVGRPAHGRDEGLAAGPFQHSRALWREREELVKVKLPDHVESGRWLNWILTASKTGAERFSETNRLGALGSVPAPKLVIRPGMIDLGRLDADTPGQWHCVQLLNQGGGASDVWTLAGAGEGITFNHTNGNLRVEQEIYFQVDPAAFPTGITSRHITVRSQRGGSDTLRMEFRK